MDSPTQQKIRANWIDVARVLAIILIVIAHIKYLDTGFTSAFGELCWYMQFDGRVYFFMMIAGYFTRTNASLGRLGNRFFGLLIPFIIWNTLCATFLHQSFSFDLFWGTPSNPLPADIPLWFLRDILVCTLLVPFFQKIKLYWPPIILLLFILQYQWPQISHYILLPSPSSVGFFLLGLFLSSFSLHKLKEYWAPYSCLFLTGGVLIGLYYGCTHGFNWENLYTPISTFERLFGIMMLISAAILIEQHFPKVTQFLLKLTPGCFFVFASHYFVYIMFKSHLSHDWLSNYALLVPFMVMIICWGAFYGIRMFLPFLLPIIAHEKTYKLFKN